MEFITPIAGFFFMISLNLANGNFANFDNSFHKKPTNNIETLKPDANNAFREDFYEDYWNNQQSREDLDEYNQQKEEKRFLDWYLGNKLHNQIGFQHKGHYDSFGDYNQEYHKARNNKHIHLGNKRVSQYHGNHYEPSHHIEKLDHYRNKHNKQQRLRYKSKYQKDTREVDQYYKDDDDQFLSLQDRIDYPHYINWQHQFRYYSPRGKNQDSKYNRPNMRERPRSSAIKHYKQYWSRQKKPAEFMKPRPFPKNEKEGVVQLQDRYQDERTVHQYAGLRTPHQFYNLLALYLKSYHTNPIRYKYKGTHGQGGREHYEGRDYQEENSYQEPQRFYVQDVQYL